MGELLDVDAIRARHTRVKVFTGDKAATEWFICSLCGTDWPCDTIRALDALAASEAAVQEARTALREIEIDGTGEWDRRRACGARAALDSGHQEGASHLEGERE